MNMRHGECNQGSKYRKLKFESSLSVKSTETDYDCHQVGFVSMVTWYRVDSTNRTIQGLAKVYCEELPC